MSQAGIINTSGGPVPPQVPTSFVTNSGTAIPVANILNVLATDTTSNFDNGITDTGSGNTVTILLTNRATNGITTVNATPTTLITLPLGAAGTYYVWGNAQAFASSIPGSSAFTFSGAYRTDGATATVLGTEYHDTFQDASMAASDVNLTASGNSAIFEVTGIAATNVSWNALLEFRQVN